MKTFTMRGSHTGIEHDSAVEGVLCMYEDLEEALKENERLREESSALQDDLLDAKNQIAALKREVQALEEEAR